MMKETEMQAVKEITYPCKFDGSQQPAMFYQAKGPGPRPLLVALHTWSGDHTQASRNYSDFCIENDWNFIFPNFRGPNWLEDGCGSELVVSDLEDAVAYMKHVTDVDPARVYLVGGSGGGHCTLLMAGRRPDLWTAVSAWCPISDIAAWHQQCLNTPHKGYSEHIESACGGIPASSEHAGKEARKRSPLTWLPNAANLTVDISTGIHDGHTGSVPVSQAIHAYNVLAAPEDRISDQDIAYIVTTEKIPAHLASNESDPAFGSRPVYLRKQSNKVRLTLFEGGHDLLPWPALTWLAKQIAGKTPDWSAGRAPSITAETTELNK